MQVTPALYRKVQLGITTCITRLLGLPGSCPVPHIPATRFFTTASTPWAPERACRTIEWPPGAVYPYMTRKGILGLAR